MKVRCTANQKDPVFQDESAPGLSWTCSVTPGNIYLVLAMSATTELLFHGRGVSLEILDDTDEWAMVPLWLFDVVDPRPSTLWRAQQIGEDKAGLTLSPPSFQSKFWADDLTEGVPEVELDFRNVVKLLQAEFRDGD